MQVETKSIECVCHRCSYRWQYRGNSKYITCCPRCKMTVYIPQMLRLLNEAHRNIIHRDPDEQKKRNSLEAPTSQSMASTNAGGLVD
jgi:hypothetical protein